MSAKALQPVISLELAAGREARQASALSMAHPRQHQGQAQALRGQALQLSRPQSRSRAWAPARGPVGVRADSLATSENGEYHPPAPFYKVEAVLRPWRIKFVCRGLLKQGIRGVTVAEVKGFGSQGGSRERQAGSEFTDDSLVAKAKLEVVVVADQVEAVINTIIREARTGEIGDGKIFLSPIADVIRVRTGERGVEAERMTGGRQELLSQAHILASIDGRESL